MQTNLFDLLRRSQTYKKFSKCFTQNLSRLIQSFENQQAELILELFNNIEDCLHVLSSDPIELKDTFEYVVNNYGKDEEIIIRLHTADHDKNSDDQKNGTAVTDRQI